MIMVDFVIVRFDKPCRTSRLSTESQLRDTVRFMKTKSIINKNSAMRNMQRNDSGKWQVDQSFFFFFLLYSLLIYQSESG